MSDDLESVLRRVATGELTPEQALIQLDSPGAAASTGPVVGGTDEPVTVIRLKTSYRSVQIYADPSVAQIHVSGPHSIRQEGSALVVSTSGPLDDDEQDQASAGRSPSATGGRFSFSTLPKTIAWARSWRDHQLTVRVNPALAVELDATGADVKASGLDSGLRAHFVASSFKADKLRGVLDIEALSSSIKVSGIPTGNSRLYCESSSARLTLRAGADLKITATNRMGRLVLPELPPSRLPFEGEVSEVVIGEGRDKLNVESVMSSVIVSTHAWDDALS
jgi:hypothetical protein